MLYDYAALSVAPSAFDLIYLRSIISYPDFLRPERDYTDRQLSNNKMQLA